MPFASKAQQRFMYAKKPKGVDLKEWSKDTDFSKLPEKVKKNEKKASSLLKRASWYKLFGEDEDKINPWSAVPVAVGSQALLPRLVAKGISEMAVRNLMENSANFKVAPPTTYATEISSILNSVPETYMFTNNPSLPTKFHSRVMPPDINTLIDSFIKKHNQGGGPIASRIVIDSPSQLLNTLEDRYQFIRQSGSIPHYNANIKLVRSPIQDPAVILHELGHSTEPLFHRYPKLMNKLVSLGKYSPLATLPVMASDYYEYAPAVPLAMAAPELYSEGFATTKALKHMVDNHKLLGESRLGALLRGMKSVGLPGLSYLAAPATASLGAYLFNKYYRND